VIAIGAAIFISASSQMITPMPLWAMALATLAAIPVGVRLGQIMKRLNRERPTARSDMAIFLAVVLALATFYPLTWTLAERVAFRNGGTSASAVYPVIRVTHDKHDRNHWVMINPFGLFRGAIVPISASQYRALIQGCGGPESDCSGAGLCVTLPIEQAANGAVRVMASEDSTPPQGTSDRALRLIRRW
jgi:hypothetical protein